MNLSFEYQLYWFLCYIVLTICYLNYAKQLRLVIVLHISTTIPWIWDLFNLNKFHVLTSDYFISKFMVSMQFCMYVFPSTQIFCHSFKYFQIYQKYVFHVLMEKKLKIWLHLEKVTQCVLKVSNIVSLLSRLWWN